MTLADSPKTTIQPERLENHSYTDAIIIGAGISGIGAAVNYQEHNPNDTYIILDAHDSYGGTWWTHRYPGARSDSDLYTYGYDFKPWTGPALAEGDMILDYLSEVIDEHHLAERIHYSHKVVTASWCSQEQSWTLTVYRKETHEWLQLRTQFLIMGHGYFDHDTPYAPKWEGSENYQGMLVHPQHWPEDLEYENKRIVVIGSGSTAGTLVPALAERAAHVTMLQRTPSYYNPRPVPHEFEEALSALDLAGEIEYEVLRKKNIYDTDLVAKMFHEEPETLKEMLVEPLKDLLPSDLDIEKHFDPPYAPWQQRIVTIKNGDLFNAISNGSASVVTDSIDHFTETGIRTASGEHLEADIVVSATGFNMSVFGNVDFIVDDEPVDFSQRLTWRGLMIEGVPNMVYVIGYWRHSWTLRVQLINQFIRRLQDHMADENKTVVVPEVPAKDADMPRLLFSDPDNFNPGYVMRKQDVLYKRGDRAPWIHMLDYEVEREILPFADLNDGLTYR